MTWDAIRYDLFQQQHQFACGMELLAQLEKVTSLTSMSALDLGCGTGDLALAIGKRVGPRGSVTAIDNNDAMLTVLCGKLGSDKLAIHRADMVEWLKKTTNSYDILFSNAAIHWLPSIRIFFDLVHAGKRRLNPLGYCAFRFSLENNARVAKEFVERCLTIYTGDSTITLRKAEFRFGDCLAEFQKIGMHIIYATEITYSPFDNWEADVLWMLASQPLLKYLTKAEMNRFELFLRDEYAMAPCKVNCHHGVFITQKW